MSFPAWAPECLVNEYLKLKDSASRYRHMVDDDPGRGLDYEKIATHFDEMAGTLFRLLTWQDMESAWASLSRPCANHRVLHSNIDGLGEYLLWDCISRALDDFARLSEDSRSGAEKRKNLLSIAKKADELRVAVLEDQEASRLSGTLIQTVLSAKNIELRESNGEIPTAAELTIPMAFLGDLQEAKQTWLDIETDTDGKQWNDWPLATRLAYWSETAGDTGLCDLLEVFANALKDKAQEASEIKQPGRGKESIKPFMLRRVSEYVRWLHNQPLDDAVARIVTAILDLETPLTRDDVRPYVRLGGKKSA